MDGIPLSHDDQEHCNHIDEVEEQLYDLLRQEPHDKDEIRLLSVYLQLLLDD